MVQSLLYGLSRVHLYSSDPGCLRVALVVRQCSINGKASDVHCKAVLLMVRTQTPTQHGLLSLHMHPSLLQFSLISTHTLRQAAPSPAAAAKILASGYTHQTRLVLAAGAAATELNSRVFSELGQLCCGCRHILLL